MPCLARPRSSDRTRGPLFAGASFRRAALWCAASARQVLPIQTVPQQPSALLVSWAVLQRLPRLPAATAWRDTRIQTAMQPLPVLPVTLEGTPLLDHLFVSTLSVNLFLVELTRSVAGADCPAGSSGAATDTCVVCAVGKYSADGATDCAACDAGKADDDADPSTPCEECDAGTFADEQASTCELCPPGWTDDDEQPVFFFLSCTSILRLIGLKRP